MKVTCGTDIVEIDRIKKLIDENKIDFIDRVYSENEIEYCESKHVVKYQHYAARFAAKEAIFKAISANLDYKYEISWKDVEIINDERGRPHVRFINKEINGLESIDISISHCKKYAVANTTAVWFGA